MSLTANPRPSDFRTAGASSEAKERVTVQENGTRKSMTKTEAAIKQLFNKATTGDQRAIKLMADLMNLHTGGVEPVAPRFTLTEADREVLMQMIARAQQQSNGDDNAQ